MCRRQEFPGMEYPIAPFRADYAPADEQLAAQFIAIAPRPEAAEKRIDARATRLIEAVRAHAGGLGGIEDFLPVYSLSTKEGPALMGLAAGPFRGPDAAPTQPPISGKPAA